MIIRRNLPEHLECASVLYAEAKVRDGVVVRSRYIRTRAFGEFIIIILIFIIIYIAYTENFANIIIPSIDRRPRGEGSL